MPILRIHLEPEELSAVRRRAAALGVTAEALAYTAINCSMTHCRTPFCKDALPEALPKAGTDLPLWSDRARSVGVYQGMPDIEQGPGPAGP